MKNLLKNWGSGGQSYFSQLTDVVIGIGIIAAIYSNPWPGLALFVLMALALRER